MRLKMERMFGEHGRLANPVLEQLRRKLDKVLKDVSSRESVVSNIAQHSMQPMA